MAGPLERKSRALAHKHVGLEHSVRLTPSLQNQFQRKSSIVQFQYMTMAARKTAVLWADSCLIPEP